jgi:hypothetical protein
MRAGGAKNRRLKNLHNTPLWQSLNMSGNVLVFAELFDFRFSI